MSTQTEAGRWPVTIRRSAVIDDAAARPGRIHCDTCGRDATGRVIDAYAGVFGVTVEINDEFGHYTEELMPYAWNKRLADLSRSRQGLRGVGVFANHGMTLHGTPSETGTTPVGHPLSIAIDGHGLLTATHYGTSDVGERAFRSLMDGDVSGHSWTGRLIDSDPPRVPRAVRGAALPHVRRKELGLDEYGPTPIPYYTDAVMVGARARVGEPPAADEPPAGEAVAAAVDLDVYAAQTQMRLRRARLMGIIG